MKFTRFGLFTIALAMAWSVFGSPQESSLNTIYADESHCLTSPDMRGPKDKAISCFCRDAIADAQYVYHNYLLSGKDRNLNGVFLVLVSNIGEQCGKPYDWALQVPEEEHWNWQGPEVVRTYPSDEVILRIKPDHGVRHVPYTVQLVYRDSEGRVTRTEDYSSQEVFPESCGACSPKKAAK